MALPIKSTSPLLIPSKSEYPDAPTPPSSPRPEQPSVQQSFRCLAITFGIMSATALFGGAYCFFSPPTSNSDGSENYSQQILGITLIALGTLGTLGTGCLAFSKVPQSELHDEEDGDEGIFL